MRQQRLAACYGTAAHSRGSFVFFLELHGLHDGTMFVM